MSNHILDINKIDDLRNEILSLDEQINKNEGKTPFREGMLEFLFILITFLCMNLAGFFAIGLYIVICSLMGYATLSIGYDKISIQLAFGFVALLILGYILELISIYNNREKLYKKENNKGFFSKAFNVGKNFLFKKIYEKNYPLLERQENLRQEFNNSFNENSINVIFDFYKNNPYEFGSYEHEELSNNFKKIKDLYRQEDYINLFSLYYEDYEEYKYQTLRLSAYY